MVMFPLSVPAGVSGQTVFVSFCDFLASGYDTNIPLSLILSGVLPPPGELLIQ